MKLQVTNLGKVSITVEKDPWTINRAYDRLTIVENELTSYISRKPVPKGQPITNNRDYWVPFGTRSAVTVSTFKILQSESNLPDNYDDYDGPYLIAGAGYFWVGTEGNVLDGKYQTIQLQGSTGEKGDKGDKGDPGTNGTDGKTPYIGSDGYWWIGDARIEPQTMARGPQGPQGTPGTNGKDGKDGAPGTNGANGANGLDGKDGSTPYIGNNGNWYIDGVDTGKPSRGPQGPQGPAGSSGEGGGNTNVYVDEENKRIVFVVGEQSSVASPVLYSPAENSSTMTLTQNNTTGTILVNGDNLSADVKVSTSLPFRIKRTDADTFAQDITLTKEEVNNSDGVLIKINIVPPSGSVHANGTLTVASVGNDFTTRNVGLRYTVLNPLTPGITPVTPGGSEEFNPNL